MDIQDHGLNHDEIDDNMIDKRDKRVRSLGIVLFRQHHHGIWGNGLMKIHLAVEGHFKLNDELGLTEKLIFGCIVTIEQIQRLNQDGSY